MNNVELSKQIIKETAKMIEISEEHLARLRTYYKRIWEESGGDEGAKDRLDFANEYLNKEKNEH